MDQHAREAYIEAQVLTATPQKLRLMLIEGAIRFARQTIQHWQASDNERALESIIRCRNIVSELLSSIRVEESDLTKRVAGLYLFVFQNLTEAQLRRDAKLVEEAIGVLEVERGTWRDVCEKMPHAPVPTAEHMAAGPREIIAPMIAYPDAGLPGSSISFNA
jgi:flagellar protein FliS